VILVGDQQQHGAVEAGRPITQMQRAGMTTARLDTIRRQRDPALRQAVGLAAKGKTDEAVRRLDQQGRVSEIPERDRRYATIARAYADGVEAGESVLVVSPANDERTALNTVIRTEMQARGYVAREGREQPVLVNRNITGAQRAYAGNYEVGDVVRYTRGSRKAGLSAGAYAKVEAVDRERHRLTVRTADGTLHHYSPQQLRGVEVYREERREFAAGDRIQFRAPLREHQIANGTLGRIERLDRENGKVTITLDSGASLSSRLDQLRHLEYGYATTSHSSQGATVDRVLVQIDTERSATLVNRQQVYVSVSRARVDAQVFTNDKGQLPHAVARDGSKTTALEALRESRHLPARYHERALTRDDGRQRTTVQTPSRWQEQELGHDLQRPWWQERYTGRQPEVSPWARRNGGEHGRIGAEPGERAGEWRHERRAATQRQATAADSREWRHERLAKDERGADREPLHGRDAPEPTPARDGDRTAPSPGRDPDPGYSR
jgi:ATP-dependent exoDNAse (exonuclease V) alpha subunit